MFKNGFVLIAPEYVLGDTRSYHVFKAKQHILTEEIVLQSNKSICGRVLLNKKPLCRRFEEDLGVLSMWASMTIEDQFCRDCGYVSGALSKEKDRAAS
ncbi:MAG: hypothetical protein J5787_06115 [Alphaproteobacteria bacterium]|nr:hypothetical protein [Alphaproteobacteria bacterium]